MINGTVTRFDDSMMIVTIDRNACAACLEGRGCGMGLLAAGRERFRELSLPTPSPRPEIGGTIAIGSDYGLVLAAALAYGMPLLGLLVGASIGDWLLPAPGSVILAFTGMAASAIAARRFARQRFSREGCQQVARAL